MKRFVLGLSAVTALGLILVGIVVSQLPAIGAGALLLPSRHVNSRKMPGACAERTFTGRAFYFPAWSLAPAFARAERDGNFVVDDVSPARAAAAIAVPVLLVHRAADRNTPPSHSARVFEALAGSKRLITVPDAGHNDVLRSDVWQEIEGWLSRLPGTEGSLPK